MYDRVLFHWCYCVTILARESIPLFCILDASICFFKMVLLPSTKWTDSLFAFAWRTVEALFICRRVNVWLFACWLLSIGRNQNANWNEGNSPVWWHWLVCCLPGHSRLEAQLVYVHRWKGIAETQGWGYEKTSVNAEKDCVSFILYIQIGLVLSCTVGRRHEREEWQREWKSRMFISIGGIRYECAPWSLLMGTSGGPGRETGHRSTHTRTHSLTQANAHRLYYPQAEHHELQGYTSMLIGWGVWRIY